jgi:2-isopropylmalate synthase
MTNTAIHDKEREYLYDWNKIGESEITAPDTVEIDDETLRDGLQSPSVRQPDLGEKIQILHHMEAIGIHAADIGYPGAGPKVLDHVVALAEEIDREGFNIVPNCAGRTHPTDILPIAEAQQRSGVPIEAALFLGSSPIRQFVEGWDADFLVETTVEAVCLARREGLEVMYVTEDTTRAKPGTIDALFKAAIEHGASRLCVCDTVGHATPHGVRQLVAHVQALIGDADVKIDWHGHNDRGLGLINAIAAIEAGVDQVHGTALGVGERCGNTSMDQLLVNMRLMGFLGPDVDLTQLPAYVQKVSEYCQVPVPYNYPVVGKDAFETATGVHAAAVIKALRKGDDWLANRVYSGVPADVFGLEQRITIGPMSGRSNVTFWLEKRGYEPKGELVDTIFNAAKRSHRIFTDEELVALIGQPADAPA